MSQELQSVASLGPIGRWWKEVLAVLGQAWPLSLSFLCHMAMGLTDAIMVGRLGALELGATSLSATIFFVVFLFNMGIVTAVTPLASQYLGAKNPRMMRRAVRQGLWAGGIVSIPMLVILWYIEPILNSIGQPEELTKLVGIYMSAYMWVLPTGIGYIAIRCFMTAVGAPKPIMVVTIIALMANIVLNYGLIFGNLGLPRLELVGAGIASAIVTALEFIILALVATFMRPYKKYYILGRIWRPDWVVFRRIFVLGTPIALGMMMEEGYFMVTMLMMGYVGTTEVTAHAMTINLVSIAYMISLGVAEAGSARVGNAFGRRDFKAVVLAGWSAMHIAWLITLSLASLLFIFPEAATRIFLDTDLAENADVLALAASLMAFAAFMQISDGTQLVLSRSLHGLSDTKIPMLLNFFGFWIVGVSVSYTCAFPLGYGAYGVWYGLYAASITSAICYIIRYFMVSRKAHERTIG